MAVGKKEAGYEDFKRVEGEVVVGSQFLGFVLESWLAGWWCLTRRGGGEWKHITGDGELCLEYGELGVPAGRTSRSVQSLVAYSGMKPRS